MAANRKVFLLHTNNVIIVVKEWHYGEFYPAMYFYYKPDMTTERYILVYEGKKFIHYERIQEKISGRVQF